MVLSEQISTALDQLIEQHRLTGPKKFSSWNEDTFESYAEGPIRQLADSLLTAPSSTATDPAFVTVSNFVQLIAEGIGRAWLNSPGNRRAGTFLEYCLLELVPACLSLVSPQHQSKTLAKIWNLGEGLAHEPAWLNQFAIVRSPAPLDLARLDQHLASVLSPLFTPPASSTWKGRSELFLLDPAKMWPTFLPGRTYLASPFLLCVQNRINPAQILGVMLLKDGRSEIAGMVGDLPEYSESFKWPTVVCEGNRMQIGEVSVVTPWITPINHCLCVQSGFVVISAEDSQQLFVAEVA